MKISIIMCVKDSMPYIMSSIKSFEKQDYKNKELVVVYSKSEDSSYEYLKTIKDKNIKIYNFEGSIYKSLNFGIKKAKGDIIGVLHSDDIFFSKNTISKVVKVFKFHRPKIIYGDIAYSLQNNLLKIKRTWNNINLISNYDLPPHTGTFISKEIYKKYKYNTNFLISGDTDLLIKIFKDKYKTYYIRDYIIIMRDGGISTKINSFLKKMSEDLAIYKKYNFSKIDYVLKVLSKIKQFFFTEKFKHSKYHNQIDKSSKIKFISLKKKNNIKGRIISALNLAFISYNYKFKIITHKFVFWPDGLFATLLFKKKKIPGRKFFVKIINMINNKTLKFSEIYVCGNLPIKSEKWIKHNLKHSYKFIKLPFGENKDLKRQIRKKKFKNNSLIIMTIPTPKQEIVGNEILKKLSSCSVVCIGGAINILSGHETKSPQIFNDLNLEWLWRLRFDTKRRLGRLLESLFLFVKIKLLKVNNIY